VRPVAVRAALVDVADEEVGTALVAALADLPQQLPERDAGLFCPALAEVAAVRVDESGAVLRDALQPLRLAGAVIALDYGAFTPEELAEAEQWAASAVERAGRTGSSVRRRTA
jgi:hypothetical protein